MKQIAVWFGIDNKGNIVEIREFEAKPPEYAYNHKFWISEYFQENGNKIWVKITYPDFIEYTSEFKKMMEE